MKFVAIKNRDGEIALCHQESKEKIIKKVLKEIKTYLLSKDCEYEITIDDLDVTTSRHKMYSRWIDRREVK